MVEVNGQHHQHATTKFVAVTNGVPGPSFPIKTIKKIDYKVKAPKEITNDSQGQPDGFVMKKQENEASMSMKLSEFRAFRKWLLANNPGVGTLQAQFDLPVSYGSTLASMHTDTLHTVMLNEEGRTSEDSQDPDYVEVPLFFITCDFHDGPAVVYQ